MPDIRYVVLSDLHFGAQNSVLTAQFPNTVDVDPSSTGEVMTLLVECLRELIEQNEDPSSPPTLVLGGDVLELALAEDQIALMVFERFMELAFRAGERLFADEVIFVPGNHDHHLWESARERHFADTVVETPPDEPLAPPRHTTRMLLTPDAETIVAQVLSAAVGRHPELAGVHVRTVYPNVGFVNERATRAVVFHHGHYVEPMYRLVSTLNQIMFRRPEPSFVEDWEAENFAWVDFFWSTLGRSGQAGKDVSIGYDLLQSPAGVDQLIDNLAIGLGERVKGGRVRKGSAVEAIRTFVQHVAEHFTERERLHTGNSLSDEAEEGVRRYLEGPVLLQLVDECNGEVPPNVSFLFGHTHKPFAVIRDYGGYTSPVEVANTGGWVVDSLDPVHVHGAAAVLLDEGLDSVLLQMYSQHDRAEDYRVTVEALPDAASHAFGRRITKLVDNDRGCWKEFNRVVAATVQDRYLDLATIIDRATITARGPRVHRRSRHAPK